ncbi:MAG TPA: DUF3775 domain-containing protein, partial [Stellaceae bacterium]|nr:DUF3775 domain-containing protein [Stellaceae bacterium]
DNPSYQELVDAINSLNEPGRIELLALTWLERGDYIKEEWRAALEEARRIHDEKETDFFSLRASVGAQRTTRTSQASGWTLRGPACSGARPTESLRAIGGPPERGQSHGLPARAHRRQCGATMQDGARPPSSTPKNVARTLRGENAVQALGVVLDATGQHAPAAMIDRRRERLDLKNSPRRRPSVRPAWAPLRAAKGSVDRNTHGRSL